MTQGGNLLVIIGFVSFLLNYFGVNIAEEELQKLSEAILIALGILLSWYGRYRKGDLKLSGFRR